MGFHPEKNHCQSEGISGKLWTHAAIIVIRLWVGVGQPHAGDRMGWLGRHNRAISGTSNNTNGVGTLDTGFADPDMEAVRQKLNEMILNGLR